VRGIRLRLCGWLYRLAYRIDPGDHPNAPRCPDHDWQGLDADGTCCLCEYDREQQAMLRAERRQEVEDG
jgi:rubredoxin